MNNLLALKDNIILQNPLFKEYSQQKYFSKESKSEEVTEYILKYTKKKMLY